MHLCAICYFSGIPAFDRLPYFDAITDVVPEPMHMIARIGLIVVKTLTCVSPMDGWKVRIQEQSFGRFRDACPLEDDPDAPLPQAPWSLTQVEIKLADRRRSQVLAPIGFGFRPNVCMFESQSRLKSYDWFQVTTYIPFSVFGTKPLGVRIAMSPP